MAGAVVCRVEKIDGSIIGMAGLRSRAKQVGRKLELEQEETERLLIGKCHFSLCRFDSRIHGRASTVSSRKTTKRGPLDDLIR